MLDYQAFFDVTYYVVEGHIAWGDDKGTGGRVGSPPLASVSVPGATLIGQGGSLQVVVETADVTLGNQRSGLTWDSLVKGNVCERGPGGISVTDGGEIEGSTTC